MTRYDRLIQMAHPAIILPPPPAPSRDLRESTIRRWPIFVWGEVHHPDGNFTVDREFFSDLKEWISREDGYRPPIWRDHTSEGIAYGRVMDLIATEEGIDVVADLTDWLCDLYDKGHVPNWSPSFYTNFTDSTGRIFRRALKELSFVGVPHMKQVPQVLGQHYLMSEDGMIKPQERATMAADIIIPAPDMDGEGSEASDMGARLDALESKLGDIYDMIKAMAPAGEELKEPGAGEEMPKENMSEGEDMKALKERLSRLERENQTMRREKVTAEIRATAPGASKQLTESLIRLSESAPADYQIQLSELGKLSKQATPATLPGERGAQGSSVQIQTRATDGAQLVNLMESAKRANIQRGAGLLSHLESKGINPAAVDPAVWQESISKVYGG